MNNPPAFSRAAHAAVQAHIDRLRTELSFADARDRPAAEAQDIVVAGKEVQVTTYRQTELPFLKGRVLITVQLARFGLGGTTTFQIEKGLVFSPDAPPREASESEMIPHGGG